MNNLINLVMTASKGKSPVVAIPIEGKAPVCVRTKLLKGALKNVTVKSVDVFYMPNIETLEKPEQIYLGYPAGSVQPEGPANLVITPGERRLRITGRDGFVKTSCTLIPVPRRTAIKELSAWSEKERVKLQKKTLLGDAGNKLAKVSKSYEYALDGDDAVTVHLRDGKGTFETKGIAIKLAAMPDYKFVLHSSGSAASDRYDWRVSELSSGMCASGSHRTAKEAIETAEIRFKELTPERLTQTKQRIEEYKIKAEPKSAVA
jgi:hypothetical protein